MKKISLAIATVGLLALAACNRGNEEQLGDNVELNAVPAEDLNALSDDAANLASESQQLENQAAELDAQAETDNATGAQTPADENIQGM